MKKYCIIILALLFVSAVSRVNAWEITSHFDADATGGYNYKLYTPDEASAENAEALPLVIFLHGASLKGTNLNKVENYGTLDAIHRGLDLPAYVLAPQCQKSWDSERIMLTVEGVKKACCIDTTRIYVIGMSLGGYGTLNFAAAYPDKVAAAMGICGGASRDASPLAEVPTYILHGTADNAVSIAKSEKVVEAIKAAGGGSRLIFKKLPGVNHSRPARFFYCKEVYDWLFAHRLTDEGRPVCRDYDFDNQTMQDAYKNLPRHGGSVR